MSNVVQFRKSEKSVVIDYGYDETDKANVNPIYLVDVVEGVSEESVWFGDTHQEGRRIALAIAEDRGGLPIIDKVTA